MAESIRTVVVTIQVDTNKQTYERQLVWGESETFEEFQRRVAETIEHLTELS